jgi:hypothetical protein
MAVDDNPNMSMSKTSFILIILLLFLTTLVSGCTAKNEHNVKNETNLSHPSQPHSEPAQQITPQSTPHQLPQPPIPAIPKWEVEVTGDKRDEVISLALNHPTVKKWLNEGYEVVNVTLSRETYWVYILTNKQILPWITGITLKVPVYPGDNVQVGPVNFDLTLSSISEEQRNETLKIALSDPKIRKYIGNRTYEVEKVEVSAYMLCYKECMPYAYPTVFLKVNPEPWKYGVDYRIYVDLKNNSVAYIQGFYRKPSPPYLNNSSTQN